MSVYDDVKKAIQNLLLPDLSRMEGKIDTLSEKFDKLDTRTENIEKDAFSIKSEIREIRFQYDVLE